MRILFERVVKMKTLGWVVVVVSLLSVCAGCANGTGGQVVGGILSGIGAGLSGL